jgi:hypothetical protein
MQTLTLHTPVLFALQVPGVLRTLLDRMRNEITRLAAVRAYASIAQSPQTVDLAGGWVGGGRENGGHAWPFLGAVIHG